MILLWQIFFVFFRINLLSFGGVFGVLPELERMVVNEHGWLNHERFIQSYVVSQFVPGPNMAMCPLIGYWVAGWPGWIAGFLGIYSCPILVMVVAYYFFVRYRDMLWVQHVEQGFRPLVFGLMLASCARLWWSQSLDVSLAGVSAWVQLLTRALAIGLTAFGIAAYVRRWIGSFKLVFVIGFLWWGINRLLILGFVG